MNAILDWDAGSREGGDIIVGGKPCRPAPLLVSCAISQLRTYAVVSCVLSPALCAGAEISGYIRNNVNGRIQGDPLAIMPPPQCSVTLCAEDRVYRAPCDSRGQFVIHDIVPGTYDLVAKVRGLMPESITQLHLQRGDSVGPIPAIILGSVRENKCYVSTENQRILKDYSVDYGPIEPNRSEPVVKGTAYRRNESFRRKGSVKYKPMTDASVELFRNGEIAPALTARTDRRGEFVLRPQAGTYELVVRHKGYNEVKVSSFLVPKENVTLVEVIAATKEAIVVAR